MNTRQSVYREVDTFDFEDATLATILATVQSLIVSYGSDAVIRCEREAYSNSDRTYPRVYIQDPETDEEMAKRISYNEKYTKISLENEKSEYERLKAKFGVEG